MQAYYRDVDSKAMDIIEATMLATRLVKKLGVDTVTGEIDYKWIG